MCFPKETEYRWNSPESRVYSPEINLELLARPAEKSAQGPRVDFRIRPWVARSLLFSVSFFPVVLPIQTSLFQRQIKATSYRGGMLTLLFSIRDIRVIRG